MCLTVSLNYSLHILALLLLQIPEQLFPFNHLLLLLTLQLFVRTQTELLSLPLQGHPTIEGLDGIQAPEKYIQY